MLRIMFMENYNHPIQAQTFHEWMYGTSHQAKDYNQ